MQTCNDPVILRQLAITLKQITKLEVYKQKKGVLNSIKEIFPFSEKKVFSKLEKYAISLESDVLRSILKETTAVVVSQDGLKGVIFLETEGTRRLILKPSDDVFAEFFAERFLDAMGFETPTSQIIAMTSDEGQLIRETMEEKNLRGPPSEERTKEKTIADAVEQSDHILAMNILDATTFKQLLPDQIQNILTDSQILQQIGEMVFFDHFLNNRDRVLAFGPSNTGNFMLMEDNRTLGLIDNTVKTSGQDRQAILNNLELLLSDDKHANKLLGFFLITMESKAQVKLGKEEKDFIQTSLKEGIFNGTRRLLERLPTAESLEQFKEVASPDINFEILSERLELVRRVYKEMQASDSKESETSSE